MNLDEQYVPLTTGDLLGVFAPMMQLPGMVDGRDGWVPDFSGRVYFNTMDKALRWAIEWQVVRGLPAFRRVLRRPEGRPHRNAAVRIAARVGSEVEQAAARVRHGARLAPGPHCRHLG